MILKSFSNLTCTVTFNFSSLSFTLASKNGYLFVITVPLLIFLNFVYSYCQIFYIYFFFNQFFSCLVFSSICRLLHFLPVLYCFRIASLYFFCQFLDSSLEIFLNAFRTISLIIILILFVHSIVFYLSSFLLFLSVSLFFHQHQIVYSYFPIPSLLIL